MSEQQFRFETVDKRIIIDAVELMIDLNDEDAEDLEYDQTSRELTKAEQTTLTDMRKDEVVLKEMLEFFQQKDESILSWFLSIVHDDHEYRKKSVIKDMKKEQLA